MYISEEIMTIVEESEKEAIKFKRCLNARICPACGNHLNRQVTDDDRLPDEIFNCSAVGTCDFTHTRPV